MEYEEQDDDWDRYAEQPEKDAFAHFRGFLRFPAASNARPGPLFPRHNQK
jgi:hypothetical protein